jgi:hypothetical protein
MGSHYVDSLGHEDPESARVGLGIFAVFLGTVYLTESVGWGIGFIIFGLLGLYIFARDVAPGDEYRR